MFTYKYGSPQEWLEQRIGEIQLAQDDTRSQSILSGLTQLALKTDSEDIEEVFGGAMEADGFYSPTGGYYDVEFYPQFEDSTPDQASQEPVIQAVQALGGALLQIVVEGDNFIASFHCPEVSLAEVEEVADIEGASCTDLSKIQQLINAE